MIERRRTEKETIWNHVERLRDLIYCIHKYVPNFQDIQTDNNEGETEGVIIETWWGEIEEIKVKRVNRQGTRRSKRNTHMAVTNEIIPRFSPLINFALSRSLLCPTRSGERNGTKYKGIIGSRRYATEATVQRHFTRGYRRS